jgi:hypothetical protein
MEKDFKVERMPMHDMKGWWSEMRAGGALVLYQRIVLIVK